VCHIVALNSEGEIVLDRQSDTAESNLIAALEGLRRKVPKDAQVRVHLEASELAGWIRRVLKPRVFRVAVGDPKSTAWIAKDARKTDRLDAIKLADLLRMGKVHEVYYPEDDHRAVFKQVVQHFDDVTRQQVRIKQKIKARLRAQGVLAEGDCVYGASTTGTGTGTGTESKSESETQTQTQTQTQTAHGRGRGRDHWLAQVKSKPAREAVEQLYELLDHTLDARNKARRLMLRSEEP
jgi:hypothetical protein